MINEKKEYPELVQQIEKTIHNVNSEISTVQAELNRPTPVQEIGTPRQKSAGVLTAASANNVSGELVVNNHEPAQSGSSFGPGAGYNSEPDSSVPGSTPVPNRSSFNAASALADSLAAAEQLRRDLADARKNEQTLASEISALNLRCKHLEDMLSKEKFYASSSAKKAEQNSKRVVEELQGELELTVKELKAAREREALFQQQLKKDKQLLRIQFDQEMEDLKEQHKKDVQTIRNSCRGGPASRHAGQTGDQGEEGDISASSASFATSSAKPAATAKNSGLIFYIFTNPSTFPTFFSILVTILCILSIPYFKYTMPEFELDAENFEIRVFKVALRSLVLVSLYCYFGIKLGREFGIPKLQSLFSRYGRTSAGNGEDSRASGDGGDSMPVTTMLLTSAQIASYIGGLCYVADLIFGWMFYPSIPIPIWRRFFFSFFNAFAVELRARIFLLPVGIILTKQLQNKFKFPPPPSSSASSSFASSPARHNSKGILLYQLILQNFPIFITAFLSAIFCVFQLDSLDASTVSIPGATLFVRFLYFFRSFALQAIAGFAFGLIYKDTNCLELSIFARWVTNFFVYVFGNGGL